MALSRTAWRRLAPGASGRTIRRHAPKRWKHMSSHGMPTRPSTTTKDMVLRTAHTRAVLHTASAETCSTAKPDPETPSYAPAFTQQWQYLQVPPYLQQFLRGMRRATHCAYGADCDVVSSSAPSFRAPAIAPPSAIATSCCLRHAMPTSRRPAEPSLLDFPALACVARCVASRQAGSSLHHDI